MAWLQSASRHESAVDHNRRTVVHLDVPCREKARQYFSGLEGSEHFLQYERAKDEGEPDEPTEMRM